MTTVASKMREIADNARKPKPKELKDVMDQMVEMIAQEAKEGKYGVGLTMAFPEELSDYIPHIIGDLRHGGLHVDICTSEKTIQGTSYGIIITW